MLDLTRVDDDQDALMQRLASVCPPDVTITPAAPSLGFVHRRVGEGTHVYLLVNTGGTRIEGELGLRDGGRRVERWDARSGSVTGCGAGDRIAMTLDPCEAAVFVTDDAQDVDQQPVSAATQVAEGGRTALSGPWTVVFGDADSHPEPVTLPHVWESDPRRRDFSGTASYATRFHLPADPSYGRVLLDFGVAIPAPDNGVQSGVGGGRSYRAAVTGPVREIAQVFVNDVDCGVVWGPPYEVNITAAVTNGTNDLRLVVANTGAGALAAGIGELTELVAGVEQRYGRRFEMQELDRAHEGVVSGLVTVPSVVVRKDRQNRRHGPTR